MRRKILSSDAGITLLELMVAMILTGILTTATFKFYSSTHGQSIVQQDISDLQLVCRNTMHELKKTIRMAGYKVGSHDAYEFVGDTLCVYMQGTQPVDTVRYFLSPLHDGRYSHLSESGKERIIFELRKQTNSGYPETFSEYISGIRYNVLDSANIEIFVAAEAERMDPDYDKNGGFRSYSLTERVKIRNVR